VVVVVVVMQFNLESPCNVGSFEVLRCKNVSWSPMMADRRPVQLTSEHEQ